MKRLLEGRCVISIGTFGDEEHVIEEVVALGRGLQEGDEGRVLLGVGEVPQVLDDLVGGGGVQSRGDLVLHRHTPVSGTFDGCKQFSAKLKRRKGRMLYNC